MSSGAGLDLLEIGRPNRAFLDRDFVLFAGAVVGDGQRVSHSVSAVVGLVVVRLRVLRELARPARDTAVDPPRKILKLAALAAEGKPGRLRGLAPAEHADAGGTAHTL